VPPIDDDEAKFCYPRFSPERPSGYYLAKGVEKFGTWLPPGGFRYNGEPSVPYAELAKR